MTSRYYDRQLGSAASRLAARAGEIEAGDGGFRADDYLSADALSALLDQAGVGHRAQTAGLHARMARQGIRGPLSGALEGDLVTAQRRDLLGTAAQWAGQRAQLDLSNREANRSYSWLHQNTALELLAGNRDAALAREAAEQERKSGLWGALGGIAGGLAGSFLGPLGAQAGASLGQRWFG